MMNPSENKQFEDKWGNILKNHSFPEEKSLFVPQGEEPKTQRQFNLYHYFEFIRKKIGEKNYKTALEVGCGRGTIGLYLHKYLGVDITLLDSSEDAINLAKYNFDLWKGKGAFFVEDVQRMHFPDESFDVVVSIGLLEHLPDYVSALREQYRVLKHGGIMVSVNIPQKKSIQVLNNFYRYILGIAKKHLHKDYFRNTDTPEDYKMNAEDVCFKDVKVFYVNPFPLFTPLGVISERAITSLYRFLYAVRGLFMHYPFRGSKVFSQAHFLTGKKR